MLFLSFCFALTGVIILESLCIIVHFSFAFLHSIFCNLRSIFSLYVIRENEHPTKRGTNKGERFGGTRCRGNQVSASFRGQ